MVQTDYLVAPRLSWTGLGCDNKRIIHEDYEKLKSKYDELETSHVSYVNKCLDAAKVAGVNLSDMEAFESREDIDLEKYRTEAYDAIGLFEYEYKTGLDEYILGLKDEAKANSTPSIYTDIKKEKAEAKRMLNRWLCVREEWSVLITGLQKVTSTTPSQTFEQLSKEVLPLDAEKEQKWLNLSG